MSTREPAPVAILAARIMRAYPSLSPYSAASLAEELSAIERAQRRHAERCCCGEDGGYVRREPIVATASPHIGIPRGYRAVHDPDAEQRAGERIEKQVETWHRRIVNLTSRSGVLYRECFDRRDGNTRTLLVEQADVAVDLQSDPRGPVLLVRFPGETEASGV